MIRLEHVNKSYDGGEALAVRDLSLDIPSGQIFGLLGPNGAGKSTLLNMIAGVLSPDAGRIEVDVLRERLSRPPFTSEGL